MMMKKVAKTITAIGVTVWISGLLTAGIPLKEAVERGINRDAKYKNQVLESDISEINRKKAEMKKWFNIDLNGSYLYKSEKMELPFKIMGQTIEAGTQNNFDIKLAVVQPIFTGNILSNNLNMEIEKGLLEKYRADVIKVELAGRIKVSYYSYHLLENKKKSLLLLIDNLKLHLNRISDLYKEELVRKSDVLETQIKISESEMNVEDLNRMMAEEKINFEKLCGLNIEDIDDHYSEPIETVEEGLMYYKSHHPFLNTLDQNIRMLEIKKSIARGNYLPQINSFAELHYGRPGINFFANKWSMYFQGGIGLNLKLFDWNQLKREKMIVDKNIEQLNNQKDDVMAEVKKNLNQLVARKTSIEAQLATLETLIKTASEDATLKENLYTENQVSNVDYLSAVLTKERYESQKSERMVELEIVKLNMNTIIGRYGEEK